MNGLPVEPRVTQYLYRKATDAGVPLSGTFELTPVCNMDCKMCYVRMSRQDQEAIAPLADAGKWLELGKQARDAGMLYLLLTGGEPFSHPQFREIMEGLHAMGFLITINSNGTLIDETVVAWLKNCPPTRLNISLYGVSDETYGRLCGNPRGFTQTDRAIRLLKEAGISVKLNCSLTPYNARELPGIVEYARQRELYVQVAAYMFPPVRKNPEQFGSNQRFTPEEAAYYMAYADYLIRGRERFLEAGGKLPPPPPEEECAGVGDGILCRAGRCSFWITWQGDMMPCGMFPTEPGANVFRQPFGEVWETVKKQAAAVRLPATCGQCEARNTCRACAAMVYTESGNFTAIPRYRCDMTKAYPAQWQRLKEEMA